MQAASTSSAAIKTAYSRSCPPDSAVIPPAPISALRSASPMKRMKSASAAAPDSTAPAFRQRGSFGGALPSSAGTGRTGSSAGKSQAGGSVPPQAAMTSSAVTASGSRARAMRLAEVV